MSFDVSKCGESSAADGRKWPVHLPCIKGQDGQDKRKQPPLISYTERVGHGALRPSPITRPD